MKRALVISLLILLFGASGCNSDDQQSSGVASEKKCVAPQNSYDEGSGHYAGYEWAVENGGTCEGNSDSFNEGCEEYYDQLDDYNDCLDKNK